MKTGTTGCGSPQGTGCFCCRKVSYRPTCDLAGIENVVELVDACLQLVRFRAAKPRNGTCVADERDCENYFGRFEGAGTCGDSCGCCRDPIAVRDGVAGLCIACYEKRRLNA
ncbi:hypothetical protein CTAYLR_000783 [Chrysophaeum taylorii]|uniref:Uncharacterized protein n=1 Tax=Chrysophaeum taylorii TaxID=2483200 RepID=A0AAD7UQ74_9STRA|nr:hypothetical protein CTAYLR_000783 [Chrysophaeum taylorii]